MSHRFGLYVSILAITLFSVRAIAADPPQGKGAGHEAGDPAGPAGPHASKLPPGFDGWDDAKKAEWNAQMEEVRAKIRAHFDAKEPDPKYKELRKAHAIGALEDAGERGVPPGHLKKLIEICVEANQDDWRMAEACGALDPALSDSDPEKIGEFVRGKLAEGLRGPDLAAAIHKEQEACWAERHPGERPGVGPLGTPPGEGHPPVEAHGPGEGHEGGPGEEHGHGPGDRPHDEGVDEGHGHDGEHEGHEGGPPWKGKGGKGGGKGGGGKGGWKGGKGKRPL